MGLLITYVLNKIEELPSSEESQKLRENLSQRLQKIFEEIRSSSFQEGSSLNDLWDIVKWTDPKLGSEITNANTLIIKMMKVGKAAIVCSTSVLNRNLETSFRQRLIEQNCVDSIILLPEKLFYGTTIVTCVLVLSRAKEDNKILFINASDKFISENTMNVLSEENILEIFNLYKDRKDVKHYAKLVDSKIIEEKDYVLSINQYVEEKITESKIDIKQLNQDIREGVQKINRLRDEIEKIIEDIEKKIDKNSS
ncbi:hypothetical protein PVNG_02338 [Plasmodium vivax North Korean]|uniref:site-specific DNA-methyltransferase (adenine-specific) n=1 Tax=Plasmodium vivax North Korean TaxID=1035514 RepID=A0A0J9TKE9_PLAVI|nr:hypothetical protein PVNG_02338 [Plasmodium vivax North Korean]